MRTAHTMPAIHATPSDSSDDTDLAERRPERLGDGLGVGEDDQATRGDAEDPGREVLDQPGGDRGGDHATGEQRQRVRPQDALAAQRDQEAQRAADGDDELGGVDRADDLAGLEAARGEQRGGADGAPAAAADRVERAADQAHRDQERRAGAGLEGRATAAEDQEAVDHVEAQRQQQARDPRLGVVGREAGEERRAGVGADEARDREDRDGLPVDVAELVVGEPGDQRGADLGEVDGGRGGGRRDAGGEEQRRGGDAVRHAEGAVDQLGDEPHESEHDELAHDVDPFLDGYCYYY